MGMYLSIWSACLVAGAIVFLDSEFRISSLRCGQMRVVALIPCDLLWGLVRCILMLGLVTLPVLSIVAIVRFMRHRSCGRPELFCLFVRWLFSDFPRRTSLPAGYPLRAKGGGSGASGDRRPASADSI